MLVLILVCKCIVINFEFNKMDESVCSLEWRNLNLCVTKHSFNFRKFKQITDELHILNDGKYLGLANSIM